MTNLVGDGALPPRARLHTDATTLCLDGTWQVRFSSSPQTAPDDLQGDLHNPRLDVSGWESIPVPSSWPMHGHGAPQYTNVRFPFPVDPPHVPDENIVADHAVHFDWHPAGGTLLRLDGVDAAGEIFVNGVRIGSTRGSRIVHEFDISAAVRDGTNLLVVRVTQWAATSYMEDQDMWWLPGIFRSVTVIDRPAAGIRDLHVVADWVDGHALLQVSVDADAPVRLELPGLGHEVPVGETVPVAGAREWSAEDPRLYELVATSAGETVRLRIGFRTVRIDGARLLVNDRPILLRGVNRHEHHPDLGRVVPREVVEHELRLMKQHNINAIRTSHYPPHADLLDLADELGFWLMVECDLETHGFEPVGWRRNPADDPSFAQACVDRMARTVARDRNHPSVVMWSLGNESHHGRNLTAMAEVARAADPTRPLHYEGDPTCADVDVYSRMYAHPDEVALIAQGAEPPLEDADLDARRRGMPFILCEYAHAMGNGPGGLAENQRLFESSDRLAGGFIWEWLEHGIRRHTADGREYYGYGGDFGEAVHDGNFVADGLVDADRRPRPGLADVAAAFAPVRLTVEGSRVLVGSLHDHIGLGYLRGRWSRIDDAGAVHEGGFDLPDAAPGESDAVDLPAEACGEGVLTVSAVLAAETPWAPAGHEVAFAQSGRLTAPPAPAADAPVTAAAMTTTVTAAGDGDGNAFTLGPARIDRRTGRLRLGDVDLHGPELVLWRAPTDNDRGVAVPSPTRSGRAEADDWEAAELPRLHTRVISVTADAHAVETIVRVGPAVYDWAALLRIRYTSDGVFDAGTLGAEIQVDPVGQWPCTWARVGLRFHLPFRPRARWQGLGPGPSYPDTGIGQRLGIWESGVDELRTDFVRPQESGARSGTVALQLTGDDGELLAVSGDEFAFTVNPWSADQLAAASHPIDLPAPDDGCWLTIDLAQHGVGTAACGPGVLPAYRLTPRPVTGRLAFRV